MIDYIHRLRDQNGCMMSQQRKLARVLAYVGILIGVLVCAIGWHQLAGHGLAALLCGAQITEINVLGVQVYPSLDWEFRSGYFGWVHWNGSLTSQQTAFVALSDGLSTWIVSIIALPLFLRTRQWSTKRIILLALSLYYLDIFVHTLPSLGIPLHLALGNRDPATLNDGYQAAQTLGIPGSVYQIAIVGYALFATAVITKSLWKGVLQHKEAVSP